MDNARTRGGEHMESTFYTSRASVPINTHAAALAGWSARINAYMIAHDCTPDEAATILGMPPRRAHADARIRGMLTPRRTRTRSRSSKVRTRTVSAHAVACIMAARRRARRTRKA